MASGAGLNSRMRRFPCRAVARSAHPFGRPALVDRLRSPRMRWRHRLPVPHARPASQQGPGRMSSTRRPRFRSGPPAKPYICRPDAATWRGPTAPMRGPTWDGLHSRMWRFPWTVPGPVDTSSRPGCANLLRLSAAHPRAPSSRLSARAVGAGATSCVQKLLQIRSWSRWSWALVGNAQRGPQGEGVSITPPCAGPPSCARADCPC
jgi:hypothetical protein